MRKQGKTPWEVWAEGYKGQGPTIPYCAGIYDAESFVEACQLAKASNKWLDVDGPLHQSEKEAWAGYDAYWNAVGGVQAGLE